MARINVYLNFDGNCKEAFDFYRSVFGGEFSHVGSFADMPQMEGMPSIPEEEKNRVMHISLPISEETVLMGSDTSKIFGISRVEGNNFSISVQTDNKEEAVEKFNTLSEGGKQNMPMGETFWGSYFGTLTDRFGVNWMVNCDAKQAE